VRGDRATAASEEGADVESERQRARSQSAAANASGIDDASAIDAATPPIAIAPQSSGSAARPPKRCTRPKGTAITSGRSGRRPAKLIAINATIKYAAAICTHTIVRG
jgi:hypothetical protein